MPEPSPPPLRLARSSDASDPAYLPIPCEPVWPAASDGPLEHSVRLEQIGAIVSLVREMSCGGEVVTRTVAWSAVHEGEDRATDAYEALGAHQADLLYWSVAALVLGEAYVSDVVAPLIAKFIEERDAERARVAQQVEEARRKAEAKLAAETALGFWVKTKKGRYLLNLHRGGSLTQPLWSIAFDEAWERDRFWDWLGQLQDRFAEIAVEAQKVDWADLERRLLREMLVTEQQVKKQGLGSGGRRPLRFWRGDL